jgi:hypothetical protein
MPVSINNTTLTFNDATTQTTSAVTSVSAGTGISVAGGKTPTITNTGVTSITGAGTVSVSASTGAITITGTGGSGTVTSVATGNGLQGGTITTTGTLSVACPGYNTVGSYCLGRINITHNNTITSGTNYAAGTNNNQIQAFVGQQNQTTNNLSGTWKWMGANGSGFEPCGTALAFAVVCRVS